MRGALGWEVGCLEGKNQLPTPHPTPPPLQSQPCGGRESPVPPPSIHPGITFLFKDRPLLPHRVIGARISALKPQTSISPQRSPGLWF